RSLPGSTAFSSQDKPASLERGRLAVQEALDRRGIEYKSVEIPFFARKNSLGIFRPTFSPSDYTESVTIVIPTKDRIDLLDRCIRSIQKHTDYINWEILVINNNGSEATELYLKKNKINYINVQTEKFNFSHINNTAAQKVTSDLILFLNNDTEILSPNWLTDMVGIIKLNPSIGVVGAKLLFPNGTIQHGGVVLGLANLPAAHINKLINFDNPGYLYYNNVLRGFSAVTAACLLTRTDLFRRVGGFTEDSIGISYQDVDYCLKVKKAGFRVVYSPHSILIHYEGTSRSSDQKVEQTPEISYMEHKWSDLIGKDPSFNPNLSLNNERYEIKT
ncbi:MAG: glycosyltransferase family 2 protein, partial [Candidatus Jettenia sp.]|nr:glycosyltransferase family 2 protein [Candidatus Jettenia sp.]